MIGASNTTARLYVLLLAPLQWVLVWSVRFLPVPIKNLLIRTVIMLIAIVGVVGVWFAQVTLYRSMTGIYAVKGDNFLFGVTVSDYVISLGVLFIAAAQLRRKGSGRRE